jgi:hypothetical protein
MATTRKVLAQFQGTGALATAYTVAAATTAVVSTFTVCNQGTITDKFRLSIAVAGAADTAKQYVYYDVLVAPGKTFAGTIGMTLAATDVVRFLGPTTFSLNLFGAQYT